MKKVFILLIILIAIMVVSLLYRYETLTKQKPNAETIRVTLCGELYNTDNIYLNNNISVTQTLIDSTLKSGYDLCGNLKTDSNNSIKITKNKNTIILNYRDIRYEYIIENDNSVSIINGYDGSKKKILE
jgi:hypothetical protein